MGILRRRTRCRRCQAPLEGETLRIGFCDGCVEAEMRELKKRMQKSLAIGTALVIFLLAARQYACSCMSSVSLSAPMWSLDIRPTGMMRKSSFPQEIRGCTVR